MSEGPSDNSTGGNAEPQPGHTVGARVGTHVLADVLPYAVARLLLVAGLTGAIYGIARELGVSSFPIAVAVLFALIIAMPLGMWLFRRLRWRATAALATAGQRRRAERQQLQARLRGE